MKILQKICNACYYGNSVVIGQGLATSNYTLDVSGNIFVDGQLIIGDDSSLNEYGVYVSGQLAVVTLNINGENFNPTDSPWISNGDYLYVMKKVGLGLATPSVALEVTGTISAHIIEFSDVSFEGDTIQTDVIELVDQSDSDLYGTLYVEDYELQFLNSDGEIKSLSSPLSVSSNTGSGPLAFFINATTLAMAPVYWDNDVGQLSLTSNLLISNYYESDDGLVVSSSVLFDETSAMILNTTLDHKGNAGILTGYVLQDLNLSIEQDWKFYNAS